MGPTDNKPPILFWVISILLLLWGFAGAWVYIANFIKTPEEYAEMVETAATRQAYADYLANIPFWALAVGMIAAAARLLGAIGLLLRRAWVLPLYFISLVFLLLALYRAFVLANAASVMGGPHIAIQLVFVALSIFAVWFAYANKSRGILK